jgi:hypothetical protein
MELMLTYHKIKTPDSNGRITVYLDIEIKAEDDGINDGREQTIIYSSVEEFYLARPDLKEQQLQKSYPAPQE